MSEYKHTLDWVFFLTSFVLCVCVCVCVCVQAPRQTDFHEYLNKFKI